MATRVFDVVFSRPLILTFDSFLQQVYWRFYLDGWLVDTYDYFSCHSIVRQFFVELNQWYV